MKKKPFPEPMICWMLVLSLTVFQAAGAALPNSPSAPAADARIDPTTGAPVELNPARAWVEMMVAAKALEEGDADLPGASKEYATITRIFEQLRTIAADAFHRYAIVEGKRKNPTRQAWTRLKEWFPDFEEYARDAATHLGALGNTELPRDGGDGGEGTATSAGPRAVMSREMMRRYGMLPSGAPPAGEDSYAVQPAMSPELRARYGLSNDSGVTTAAALDEHASERELLNQRRTQVLAESAEAWSELRRAETELRRVDKLQPNQVPPTLVTDRRMRGLIEESSEPIPADLPKESADQLLRSRRMALENYHEGVYLPRLRTTATILRQEVDQMQSELMGIDGDLARLASKR